MATAKKLPSGRWRCLAYVGKTETKSGYKSFTADTKKEAERLAVEYEASHATGTVKDAIESYVKSKENILSPTTVKAYKSMQRTAFSQLKPISLSALTPEAVQAYFNSAAKKKKPKTLANEYGLLNSALDAAGYAKKLSVSLPTAYRVETHIPDKNAVQAMLDTADDDLRKAIAIASICGLRRSEICALLPEDIGKDTISVTKAVVEDADGNLIVKEPKTKTSKRTVVAPEHLCRMLLDGAQPGQRLISITPNALTQRFAHVRHRAGCEDIRFHDLRHYAVSVMIALNIPVNYIMMQTGHSTRTMVDKVYGHLIDDGKKQTAEKLTNYFSDVDL